MRFLGMDELEEKFMMAVKFNDINTVKECIDVGMDVTYNRNEALRFAAGAGELKIVKLLVENGADMHDGRRCESYYGSDYLDVLMCRDYNALEISVLSDYMYILNYFIENGADLLTYSCSLLVVSSSLEMTQYLKKLNLEKLNYIRSGYTLTKKYSFET